MIKVRVNIHIKNTRNELARLVIRTYVIFAL